MIFLHNDCETPYIDIYIDLQSITFIYWQHFYIVLTIASDHEIYCTHNKHNKNIVFSNIISVVSNHILCTHIQKPS